MTSAEPRRFHLNRLVDETGMSGLGRVTDGIQLPNGVVVMWWLVPPYSVQIYRTVDEMHFIHKHGGRNTTELVWDEP